MVEEPTPPAEPVVLVLGPEAMASPVETAAGGLDLAVEVVGSVSQLLRRVREGPVLASIVSLEAGDIDEAVAHRLAATSAVGALFLTAPGASLERAVLAERAGAVALLREPLAAPTVQSHLRGTLHEGRSVGLPAPGGSGQGDPVIVGSSPALARVFDVVARVAPSATTVLLSGESGTGKELVARTLHRLGPRPEGPFVPVNCAAIPEALLESELFGHERGAFTGAVARRTGRFERAHGGTLFLDEIGDMSLVLQAKVLRALEDRVVERVGGGEPVPVDLRVVAATNRDLRDEISAGRFREDLYYRLAVVELTLPPLRRRAEDLRELALHFTAEFARRHGRPVEAISEAALRRLEAHTWPGNIRELRNVMDRAVLLASGRVVRSSDLRLGAGSPRGSPVEEPMDDLGYPPTYALETVEADHIRRVLDHLGGHMGRAADTLGIHRNTLTRKVREYGIDVRGTDGP